jgi:hypothetical protein
MEKPTLKVFFCALPPLARRGMKSMDWNDGVGFTLGQSIEDH